MARPPTPQRSDLSTDDAVFYDRIVATRKTVQGPFTILMHSPDLAARVADVGSYIRFESGLPLAVRCLTALLVSRNFDCRFEWGGWAPLAEAAGVPVAAIEEIRLGQEPSGLSEDLGLVVKFGRQLLRSPHRLSADVFDAAVAQFGDRGAVELATSFGYFSLLTFVLNGFEVEPHEGAPQLDSVQSLG